MARPLSFFLPKIRVFDPAKCKKTPSPVVRGPLRARRAIISGVFASVPPQRAKADQAGAQQQCAGRDRHDRDRNVDLRDNIIKI